MEKCASVFDVVLEDIYELLCSLPVLESPANNHLGVNTCSDLLYAGGGGAAYKRGQTYG